MTTLKERLEILMNEQGLTTQQQLADFSGVSKGLVNQWFKGDTGLGKKPLLAFERKTRFSPQWLADGIGAKYRADKPESNSTVIGGIDAWDNHTPLHNDDVEVPFYKEIYLSAGNGFTNDIEVHNGYKLRFSKSTLKKHSIDPHDVVCVSADGDSMLPVFPDGATLGIDMSNKIIKDGQIYAINHGGLLRTKVLKKRPDNKVLIQSYNSEEYPDEEVDLSEINVIGRVFWWSVIV